MTLERSGRPRSAVVAGRFELLAELGRGAAGVVWRARELGSGRVVALKLVRPTSPAARARVQREGELAARLDHPGIVRIHALGEGEEGITWLACELVEGARTLAVVLPTLSPRERVGLVRDAARALGHAHARGVVHRDVKPENLLVDATGRVRVTDFGVATALGVDPITRSGAVVGTPYWMAPELVVPGDQPVGPPADVWALGVLLYQALTGKLPFQAESFLALAAAICEAEPARPRSLDPSVAPGLEAVCLRALSRAPVDRYTDGEALALDLDRVLRGEAPRTVSGSGLGVRALATRTRPVLLVGAVGLAAGIALALALPGDPAPDGAAALRAALANEGSTRARLETLLDAAGPLEPGLEREARLLLARRAAEERPPDREAARLHASRAVELAPRDAVALSLLVEALEGLSRGAEAVAALASLAALTDASADWTRLARARLGAGDGPGALLACRRAAERGEVALELRVGCALAGGAIDEAAAAVAGLGSDATGCLLRGRVAATRGEEVAERLLAAAVAATPPGEAERVVLELAAWYAFRGQVEEAALVLRRAVAGGEHESLSLRAGVRILDQLLGLPEEDPAKLRDELSGAGPPLGAWLLREALLEHDRSAQRHVVRKRLETALALLEGKDPSRAARARVALARLLALENPERETLLARAQAESPRDPELHALLAREHLARGRPAAALEALASADTGAAGFDPHEQHLLRAGAHLGRLELAEAARSLEAARPWAPGPTEGPEACRLLARVRGAQGQLEEEAALHARAGRLAGSHQDEARALWDVGREDGVILARVLELAPAWPEPVVYAIRADGQGIREEQQLRTLLGALRVDPTQHGSASKGLRGQLREGKSILPLLERLTAGQPAPGEPLGPLFRGWLLALLVEHRRLPGDDPRVAEGLRLLDRWLERRPTEAVAWLAHGFLALRRGWLARAERDLQRVEQLAPKIPNAVFYRALLLVRRDGDAERAAELMREAYALGFPRTDGDRLFEYYPELDRLAGDLEARVRLETAR